jgi:hypothetical protein
MQDAILTVVGRTRLNKPSRCQLRCQLTGVHTQCAPTLSKGVGTLAPQAVGTGWHAVGTPVGTIDFKEQRT